MTNNKLSPAKAKLRLCPVCDDPVHGRSDKIYCCSRCKDKHYAAERKKNAFANKVVLAQLSRNQFVLDLFGGEAERFSVSLAALQEMGFDPQFVTGIEHNKYGHKFKIFNYSWYQANSQTITVYREKVENQFCPYTYKRWLRYHRYYAENFVQGPYDLCPPS